MTLDAGWPWQAAETVTPKRLGLVDDAERLMFSVIHQFTRRHSRNVLNEAGRLVGFAR